MAWMYILECADGSYYVGSSRNLEQRLFQHESGEGGKYTAKRLPIKLAFAAEFSDIGAAYALEKQVQGWRRAKRQALINGEWEKLPELSRKDWLKYHTRHQDSQELSNG